MNQAKRCSLNEILTHEVEVFNNEQIALKIKYNLKSHYYITGTAEKKEADDIVYIMDKKGRLFQKRFKIYHQNSTSSRTLYGTSIAQSTIIIACILVLFSKSFRKIILKKIARLKRLKY